MSDIRDDPRFQRLSPEQQAHVLNTIGAVSGVKGAEAGALQRRNAIYQDASPAELRALGAEAKMTEAEKMPPESAAGALGALAVGLPVAAAPVAALGATGGSLAGAAAGDQIGRHLPFVGGPTAGKVVGALGGLAGGGIGAVTGPAGLARLFKLASSGRYGMLREFAKSLASEVPTGAEAAAPAVVRAAAAPAAATAEDALLAQATKQYAKDPAMLAVIRKNLGSAVAAPAAETVAPVAEAAAPALSKAEAAAKLEALLGNAMKEGRIAAASKEAAAGNRQLAEKILGDLQGEGVTIP